MLVNRAALAEAREEVRPATPPPPPPDDSARLRAQFQAELEEARATHARELSAAREKDRADAFRAVSELKAAHARELHSVRMKASQLTEGYDR